MNDKRNIQPSIMNERMLLKKEKRKAIREKIVIKRKNLVSSLNERSQSLSKDVVKQKITEYRNNPYKNISPIF